MLPRGRPGGHGAGPLPGTRPSPRGGLSRYGGRVQVEVLLTGIGGQGVQLCAKALAMAATADGRQAMLSAHYGGEMRGGQTEASVVVADAGLRSLPILPSAGSAYVMHHAYWLPVRDRLRPGAPVVFNTTVIGPAEDLDGAADFRTLGIPATAMAAEAGAPMAAGFVLLGAFASVTSLASIDAIVAAMAELVPPYRREHIRANEIAIRSGADAVESGTANLWAGARR